MELFFPSHDIALSHGVKHFSAPKAAEALGRDLAFLSEIWNGQGLSFREEDGIFPLPWGWDWDTRHLLNTRYGIKMANLPTDEELEIIRQKSSRRITIELLRKLCEMLPSFEYLAQISEPYWIDSEESFEGYTVGAGMSSEPRYVLKTPWSSSGRGLILSTVPKESQRKMALAAIRKMGGIVGEQWIQDKQQDFAMLFYGAKGKVRFIGYSLFENQQTGSGVTYGKGYLLSNEEIEKRLGVERLSDIAKAYEKILTEVLEPVLDRPWPLGYMGIDMLTYGEGNVHPCIEFNLRCTMGVVCRCLYERDKKEGTFSISQMDDSGRFHVDVAT